VTDNLIKMAHHILGGDIARFRVAGSGSQHAEHGAENIEERVSQADAEKLLDAWKKLKVQSETLHTSTGEDHLLGVDNRVKD